MSRWSIRTQSAVVFATAAMALTTLVVVFTNLASQAGLRRQLGPTTATSAVSHTPRASAEALPTVATGPATATRADHIPEGASSIVIVREVAAQQWQWALVGIVGAGIIAAVLGWLVARRVLAPIDRVSTTASRISESNLHERIAVCGPNDELRRLATSFNALLDRLGTAFERQRRFVGMAAHELRTPLAVQRAAVQVGLADGVEITEIAAIRNQLLEQNRRTERLIESLLALADAERDLDGRIEWVDLADVVRQVVAERRADATTAERTVLIDAPTTSMIKAEPRLVAQLVANLVANAIEYNKPGGSVEVRVGADGLVVQNDGSHLHAEHVTRLVEPFFRGESPDGAGRHSGLGLAIVAAIVRAHGWTLRMVPRPAGGLSVTVCVSSS
ncbi:HAMP domain-containing sensor histidine kinase [Curtobacterium ammoniigenes]|uniref:HAMP domain-containing sensor histidine kinase n=1 Tax=Curtobacterium ammoniigenes TaxID=395387 RepID=UPI00083250E4|nr:HAMP domain-containing sensor histidine kinase [Curtobacterium ammoniigenes]